MFVGNPSGNLPMFSTLEKSIFSITTFSVGRFVFLKRFGYLEYPTYTSTRTTITSNIPRGNFVLELDSPSFLIGVGGMNGGIGSAGGGVGTVFIGFEFILKLFGGMMVYF